MARFLIEVPHSSDKEECKRAIHALLTTGSHYVTQSDWGCHDGVHKTWLIVDVDGKDEARCILPPEFRRDARITQLNKFSLQEAEEMLRSDPNGAD